MPDRIVRDELLRSHRYRTLSSDTVRLLFLHLLLTVDNLGNAEATSTAIGDVLHRNVDAQTAAKLLSELADADLVRSYQVGGKPYLHIPRFRQRLKYLGSKHPRPPSQVECTEIKKLADEYSLKAGYRQPIGGIKALEVKRSEVKRSDEKKNKNIMSGSQANTDDARLLLTFLNLKAGRSFRDTAKTLEPILARLKEGNTVSDCKAVICRRWIAWQSDAKMREFMRPKTLFGATNFAQYIGEVPMDEENADQDMS